MASTGPSPAAREGRTSRLAALGVTAVVAATAVVVAFARPGPALCDDAFISFRYARNLAAGEGLVFNPGERVEGYSNLSWTLLLALLELAGVPAILASQLLSAAAAALTILLLPELSRACGGTRTAGVVASVALAFSDPFSTWMLQGLEMPLLAALLAAGALLLSRDLEARRPPGAGAMALFAIASVTRPEGVLHAGAATLAVAAAAPRPLRAALRFGTFTSAWAVQVLFRLLYYGELLPNTYHAKVWEGPDRWSAGLAYLASYARAGGVFTAMSMAAVLLALRHVRKPAVLLAASLASVTLFFAVASGGDGFPAWRFFHPFLPLALALASAALRGRGGVGFCALLTLAALASPVSSRARTTVTERLLPAISGDPGARRGLADRTRQLVSPADVAPVRVGRWLRTELLPGALVAVNDCGMIPFESGLPIVDTVGLMDRHIARVPGVLHEKVDLDYVLSRRPDAIVLRLTRLIYGLPHDRRMVSYAPFLASYRLRHVEPFGPSAYLVFVRTRDPVPLLVPRIDLTSLLRTAKLDVQGAGAVPGRLIHGSQVFFLPPGALAEMHRLQATIPRTGSVDAATVATLDTRLHELGPASRHGISVKLPPGVPSASFEIPLPGAIPEGARLAAGLLLPPWNDAVAGGRLRVTARATAPGLAAASATAEVGTSGSTAPGASISVALPAATGLRIAFEVARVEAPADAPSTVHVLVEQPEIRLPRDED